MEFLKDRIESYTTWRSLDNKIMGKIVCKSFDFAFDLLTEGCSFNGVKFKHKFYIDWSWLSLKCPNVDFFNEINEQLNDDCIREIIKHVDLCHLIYFGTINERFHELVQEKFKVINIVPSNVGSIDIMNLRFILHLSKDSLEELSIAIDCFPTICGAHSRDQQETILETVHRFAGVELNKVCLHGFKLDDNMNLLLNMLRDRGVKVEQQVDDPKPISCTVSFNGDKPYTIF